MKTPPLLAGFCACLMTVTLAHAQQLPTNGSVESRLGKLELENGYPTEATVKKMYDDAGLPGLPLGLADDGHGPVAGLAARQVWRGQSKTIPGKGWFTYFRLYGPTQPYFDRTWALPDIEELK